MTGIKLCGLTRDEDIMIANLLRPDYIGFVFWGKSRRAVSVKQAQSLKNMLDPSISAVGVFVDEDIDLVQELLKKGIIDMAQLHGNEDGDYIKKLQENTGRKIIKALQIKGEIDAGVIKKCPADFIMLDAGMGEGKSFDWDMIRMSGFDIRDRLFLAGGLDPENVERAVKEVRPFAVDVSSGIETNGVKDREKMEAFVRKVRESDPEEKE